jgi:hypothetical protein
MKGLIAHFSFQIIKIWDLNEESLLQTYSALKTVFPLEINVTIDYLPNRRELIVATKKCAVLKCNSRVRADKSDGITHTFPITVALMNELYHFLITCATDSTIIVWDIWNGRKVNWIIRAHTALRHGERLPIEITAGCFDTRNQFLLTGASDGTLKVWNFNEGICLRNLCTGSPIVNVFWLQKRIFAMGLTITEFYDSLSYREDDDNQKAWTNYHTGSIVCASVRYPDAIVTSCTHGDMIFWRYETGHPYMKFNIKDPQKRLHIVYKRPSTRESKLPQTMRDAKANEQFIGIRKSRKRYVCRRNFMDQMFL